MKAKVLISSFLMVTLMVLSEFSFAQDKTYIVGVQSLNYYPIWGYESGKGYKGFSRGILDLFFKKRGDKFKYKALPPKRLNQWYFKEKKLDFKFPDNPNWTRGLKKNLKMYYSEPVLNYIDGVMVLPERKGFGISQLKKLGTPRGFTPWDYLDLIKSKKITIKENSYFQSTLKMVILKRTHGAYLNIAVARYQLETILKQPGALVFDPGLPHTKDTYRLSSLNHPQIIKEFNLFLVEDKQAVDNLKNRFKVE